MKVRILGCGTGFGVPRIGGDWGECDPAEPKNRRSRASILVEEEGTRILVDSGPDLREQLLGAGIGMIDAVIWTHDHADHVHGIDDLRVLFLRRGSPLPAGARPPALESIERRFSYCFNGKKGYPPTLSSFVLKKVQKIGAIEVAVVDQPHGDISSAGLRFTARGRSIGYSTDCHELTAEMCDLFSGVDLWIVDALRRRPHVSHASLDQALEWISVVAPGRAVLTHMDLSMDYATLKAELPAAVEPGYDGMEIEI